MGSQYRNSELAYEAPQRYDASEALQRPAQLAYADSQNYHQGDVYLGSLPSVQLEDRPSHHHYHHPVHHYHHRRHGEVAVSHSHHTTYHHHQYHRPYHHHEPRHSEHPGLHLGYSEHQRNRHFEEAGLRSYHVNFNAPLAAKEAFASGSPSDRVQAMEHKLAQIAVQVAHRLGTVGDCAHGPRLTYDKIGFHLAPAVATEQGQAIMGARYHGAPLFERVSASDARPGDYGVRDWTDRVQKQNHHQNKGDSFIVTGVARNGQLMAANDHTFVVPADGGRYKNLTFWRPTEAFVELYGNKA